MKDDRILKPRLRLCPFCGASGAPELITSGAAAFVRCHVCGAEGPRFDVTEYLSEDFHNMKGEDLDREWTKAKIAVKHNAMKAWNGRPWEGAYFPEELENLERKAEQSNTTNAHNALKLESGALYGASCSEAAEPCGD